MVAVYHTGQASMSCYTYLRPAKCYGCRFFFVNYSNIGINISMFLRRSVIYFYDYGTLSFQRRCPDISESTLFYSVHDVCQVLIQGASKITLCHRICEPMLTKTCDWLYWFQCSLSSISVLEWRASQAQHILHQSARRPGLPLDSPTYLAGVLMLLRLAGLHDQTHSHRIKAVPADVI